MGQNYVISPQQARSRCYAKAIKEEMRQTYSEECMKTFAHNHPKILQYKARILGGQSETNDFADWTHFLLEEYGPRERCLSLGSGIGRVERYLIKIGFAEYFETIELNPRHNVMAMRTDSRINARPGDLNFLHLNPNTYDFILCHGILHHLINIEHVLEQINAALTPDGRLLVYEYVGQDRWQFGEETLAYLRKMFPDARLSNIPPWKVSGFESIRAGDLLRVITRLFGNVCDRSVSYGGVFCPLLICNWSLGRRDIDRVLRLDDEVSRSKEVPPCYHMGVYRKSNVALPRAVPWSNEEVETRLFPAVSLNQRFARMALTIRRVVRLRTRLRSIVSWVSGLRISGR